MKHLFIGGPANGKWLDVETPHLSTAHVSGPDGWDYEYNGVSIALSGGRRDLVYVDAREAPEFKLTPSIAAAVSRYRREHAPTAAPRLKRGTDLLPKKAA